jgi:iron-sulfur cluster assembly protein
MNVLPFTLSEAALAEITHIFKEKNIPSGYGLRVGVKGGGCSGISYLFGFDQPQQDDKVFELNGIPVYIEKKHFMYVAGLEIDFEETSEVRGFTFDNPNTKF